MHRYPITLLVSALLAYGASDLEKARDAQDRAALTKITTDLASAANRNPKDANAQYRLALGQSYLAEVAIEQRDKNAGKGSRRQRDSCRRESGGDQRQQRGVPSDPWRLVRTKRDRERPDRAEVRSLRTGRSEQGGPTGPQVGPGVPEPAASATTTCPRSSAAASIRPSKISRKLSSSIRNWRKRTSGSAWSLRKAGRNAEAHKALEKALQLNPARVWTKQQLDKTPVQ